MLFVLNFIHVGCYYLDQKMTKIIRTIQFHCVNFVIFNEMKNKLKFI